MWEQLSYVCAASRYPVCRTIILCRVKNQNWPCSKKYLDRDLIEVVPFERSPNISRSQVYGRRLRKIGRRRFLKPYPSIQPAPPWRIGSHPRISNPSIHLQLQQNQGIFLIAVHIKKWIIYFFPGVFAAGGYSYIIFRVFPREVPSVAPRPWALQLDLRRVIERIQKLLSRAIHRIFCLAWHRRGMWDTKQRAQGADFVVAEGTTYTYLIQKQ